MREHADTTNQQLVTQWSSVFGLASPVRVMAKAASDPFVVLLKGLYQPVVHAPNLGLSLVDLNDGSYSKTKIYPH